MVAQKASDFGFFTFNDGDLPNILGLLGMSVNKRGYIQKENETKKCHACGKAMTVNRVGHILPGSEILCCDDPICFSTYANDYLQG